MNNTTTRTVVFGDLTRGEARWATHFAGRPGVDRWIVGQESAHHTEGARAGLYIEMSVALADAWDAGLCAAKAIPASVKGEAYRAAAVAAIESALDAVALRAGASGPTGSPLTHATDPTPHAHGDTERQEAERLLALDHYCPDTGDLCDLIGTITELRAELTEERRLKLAAWAVEVAIAEACCMIEYSDDGREHHASPDQLVEAIKDYRAALLELSQWHEDCVEDDEDNGNEPRVADVEMVDAMQACARGALRHDRKRDLRRTLIRESGR